MPTFIFNKQAVNEAIEKDSTAHGDGHLRTLVVNSDTPPEYQGRVATVLINGKADVQKGNVSVTISDD